MEDGIAKKEPRDTIEAMFAGGRSDNKRRAEKEHERAGVMARSSSPAADSKRKWDAVKTNQAVDDDDGDKPSKMLRRRGPAARHPRGFFGEPKSRKAGGWPTKS